ncbi:type III-B CRISPR module RAMP protein Cmr1 [Candidatus Acidulodesulfobacterium sp. H_13]|uniref:type III-B CRISPR module RAMP protein Cmr1 n=1 Tax=Candidatus Acidulodesulfobacterium sp. H_13 TaxID=3395470 RepID=UPI003AF6B378
MKKIEFECEIITPMFLAGADGKTPELRPPSIKGAMRFWWRAMGGHLPSEANIFGGSGEKIEQSKVIIIISKQSIEKSVADSLWSEIPHIEKTSKAGKKYKYNGLSYLLYSVLMLNERPYIKDKQTFNVELRSKNSDALKNAIASFWSLVHLGGIGTRSRRGGGNIIVTNIVDKNNIIGETNIDFLLKGINGNEIAEWLIKNYRIASLAVNKGKDTDFISEYSNLSISRFIISDHSFKDWKEALNDMGSKFALYRTSNKEDIFGTAAFGLPRKHIKTNKPKEVNRRSSPLIFKILKVGDKYYWMALRLAGEFLPERVVLKNNYKSQRPDYSKINEFWNGIKRENIEKVLSIPDTVKDLKARIVKELSPSKVVLFGSRARGDFHKDSDTDIAVETDKNIGLSNIAGSIDLVDLKNIDDDFKKAIEKEGIEI